MKTPKLPHRCEVTIKVHVRIGEVELPVTIYGRPNEATLGEGDDLTIELLSTGSTGLRLVRR